MLQFNPQKQKCTGCAACYSICPAGCISMQRDEEGFLYPVQGDGCTQCGLCRKVCPALEERTDSPFLQKAFCALTRDSAVWRRSASGGAFSEICRHWAGPDTLIVGAAWDGLHVHHTCVHGFSGTPPLTGSKYICSDVEDTFVEVRSALKAGCKAIFCGCPCQVAGLKSFLRKDYGNLLTIDLICHGAGSPAVFEACIESMSRHLGEKITAYRFRAKPHSYHEEDYICRITTEKRSLHVVRDPYMQLFLSQNALRPSCGENCRYRTPNRPGDLTIADFKGLAKVFPDLKYSRRNRSTVVANSPKGEAVCTLLKETMELRPCLVRDVAEHNPLFARQTQASRQRDAFFRDFVADNRKAIAQWTVPLTLHRSGIRKAFASRLPVPLRKLIHSILHPTEHPFAHSPR